MVYNMYGLYSILDTKIHKILIQVSFEKYDLENLSPP